MQRHPAATPTRLRFDGWIAGLGTASGTRIVVGHWVRSPFGSVSDVMLESPVGERLLLASSEEFAVFVAATYVFDRIEVTPVAVSVRGNAWTVTAGPLDLSFTVGRRGVLGFLLRAVPPPLARTPRWVELVDLPARCLLRGVRTRGSAGNGRREWYGAQDLRRIISAAGHRDGQNLGELAAVDPPVRFGFGSTPRFPALVRVTTTVEAAAE